MLWALTEARHASPSLLRDAADHVAARLDDCSPSALATLARCFALQGADAPQLFAGAAQALQQRPADFNAAALSQLALALALARHADPAPYTALYERLEAVGADAFSHRNQRQLYQAQLLAAGLPAAARKADGSAGSAAEQAAGAGAELLPPHLLQPAFNEWAAAAAERAAAVPQDELLDALRAAVGAGGAPAAAAPSAAAPSTRCTTCGVPIDASLMWRGRRVAVLYDGPEAYTRSPPAALMPVAAASSGLLTGSGAWDAVLRVPYHDWAELRTRDQRRAYIHSRIASLEVLGGAVRSNGGV